MALKRLASKCRKCPFVDKCDNKRLEVEGYLEPVAQSFTEQIAMPVMRETVDIVIDGNLQKVYKDDIERELQKHLFSDRFVNVLK